MAKHCHDAAQASRRQLASHSGTDRPRSQDADLRDAKSALFAEVSFSLPKVSNDTYPSQVLFINIANHRRLHRSRWMVKEYKHGAKTGEPADLSVSKSLKLVKLIMFLV